MGLYYFAFKISRQTISLLTLQFSKVLLPVLSSLPQNPQQQVEAFVRAARLVALFSIPMCIYQAAIADPLVRLLFAERWHPTIPLIQVMCVGMALHTISWPAASLMQAQGRFRMRMVLSFLSAVAFIGMATLGTWLASALGLAIAVSIFYSIVALVDVALATAPGRQPGRCLLSIYAVPVLASIVAVLPAIGLSYAVLPRWELGRIWLWLLQITLIFLITFGSYAILVRRISPELWRECWQRSTALLPTGFRMATAPEILE